jgi:hypothetical protein
MWQAHLKEHSIWQQQHRTAYKWTWKQSIRAHINTNVPSKYHHVVQPFFLLLFALVEEEKIIHSFENTTAKYLNYICF